MHRQRIHPLIVVIAFVATMLAGCAGLGGGPGAPAKPRVGPSIDVPQTGAQIRAYEGVRLDIVVPVFDPGLPDNPDDYAEDGIWPELRRTEANRFAISMQRALQDTGVFGDVRVAPDARATGDLYVIGKIRKSNGEDIKIAVEVVDIAGERWMKRNYDYRVKENFWQNPRNKGKDPYQPVFVDAAEDIASLLQKRPDEKLTTLRNITELRFAKTYSEDAFSQYIEQRGERITLNGLPARNDPILERTRAIRVQDGLFMDRLQTEYGAFTQRTDKSYAAWQQHSLTETKAMREAKSKAVWQGVLGAALAIGGIYAGIKGGNTADAGTQVLGIGAAAVGAALIAEGFKNLAEGQVHTEALSELGDSLNVEVAPQVIKMEETTVKLTGDAGEQFRQWRSFLKQLYLEEKTPETKL